MIGTYIFLYFGSFSFLLPSRHIKTIECLLSGFKIPDIHKVSLLTIHDFEALNENASKGGSFEVFFWKVANVKCSKEW